MVQPSGSNAARDALRVAIAALQEEQSRLAALATAREKAREQGWAVSRSLREAEAQLRQAKEDEPSRLAYEYAAGSATISPLTTAQLASDEAEEQHRQTARIQDALDAELSIVRYRVSRRQAAVHEAMAELVINSPEYRQLLDAHTAAWRHLRTVKSALRAVLAGLPILHPRFSGEADRSEPLGDGIVGYDVDDSFVQAWREALGQLLNDAETQLPSNT